MSELKKNPFMDNSVLDFGKGITLNTTTNVLTVGYTEDEKKFLEENKRETNNLLSSLSGQVPDGLISLIEGYIDYAKEVVVNRALPNIDGLNPVQRRILYTMRVLEGVKDLKKCQLLAGKVLALHPHGDSAVYKAMTRLVDSSENMNVPYLKGKGSFGKVYSNEKPSAARYTEAMLNPIVDEFFGEMEGVDFAPSYNNELDEPMLLPVSYPNILCNPTIGIAVGLASNIPPFNFNEVNNATIELIETGDIKEPLVPDFTVGGSYVRDDVELLKLMETGKSKLKVRGKWEIDGRDIIISEIPYYTNIQALQRVVKEIKGVVKEVDAIDRHGFKYIITCTNRKVVNDVLEAILSNTKLQMTIHTNIVAIVDGKPCVVGVKDLLKKWVSFRSKVLKRSMKLELGGIDAKIQRNEIVLDLINDSSKRDMLYTKSTNSTEEEVMDYLRSMYIGVSDDVLGHFLDINFRSLTIKNRKRREDDLNKLIERKHYLERAIENVEQVIVEQLKELNKKYKFPRKTEISDVDYVFEKDTTEVKLDPVPVRFVVEDKFMKKINATDENEGVGITCMSDDIVTFVDTLGRLLRVELDKIPFCEEKDRGTYLSLYLEIEDNFDIVDYDITEDKEKAFIYNDGYISVINYGEWCNIQRVTKVIQKGVSPLSHLIIGDIDLKTSHVLLLTDKGKIGFASLDFKRKNRTARTKIIEGLNEGEIITKAIPINENVMFDLIDNYDNYIGKVQMLDESDNFNSDLYSKLIDNK